MGKPKIDVDNSDDVSGKWHVTTGHIRLNIMTSRQLIILKDHCNCNVSHIYTKILELFRHNFAVNDNC